MGEQKPQQNFEIRNRNPTSGRLWGHKNHLQTVPYETYDFIRGSRAASGRAFDITVIPEPVTRRVQSHDFVASYANYYVCNGAVIAAEFGDKRTDKIAKHALQKHYPGREVITLNVDPLGELGGGIHCATQQQPKL